MATETSCAESPNSWGKIGLPIYGHVALARFGEDEPPESGGGHGFSEGAPLKRAAGAMNPNPRRVHCEESHFSKFLLGRLGINYAPSASFLSF